MNEFSFVRAWSKGIGFVSAAPLNNALLLLGLGVLVPIALQLLLFGMPMSMMSPAVQTGMVAPAAAGIATAAGFVLQSASFFACWRLGLGHGETLKGALGFGLLAGVMVSVGFAAVLIVLAGGLGLIAVPLAVIAVLVALVGILAVAWTAFAAFAAVMICIMFLFALAFGAAAGDMTLAATMVGGGGWVWTLLVAGSLVLLWLAARLSCTTVLMAERRSFNLVAAIRDSWSLTWDDEWRIVRYLGLLGLGLAFAVFFASVLAGAGVAATLGSVNERMSGIAPAILLPVLSIPFAYLSVLVPAGIYRELAPADVAAAEVFA